jgi:membrane protease YdiL (CAAX protease family)
MTNFYHWNPEDTQPVITILAVTLGFIIYWFLSINERIKKIFFNRWNESKAWIYYVVYQKLTGAVFMGFLPGIVVCQNAVSTLHDFGLNIDHLRDSILYTSVIGGVILFLNYFASKKPDNLAMYPQMRIESWSTRIIILNTVAWLLYLLSYEFMYRGLLLMVCYSSFGFWPAVAINLSFYSATHIAKGARETFGAFPYGLLLCFITVSTGSIVVAVSTHLILALSNDYFSVHHNPKMKFL